MQGEHVMAPHGTFEMPQGLGHELEMAFARTGWTRAEVHKLTKGQTLAMFRDVIRGLSVVTPISRVIDCSAAPFIPSCWSYREEDQLPCRVRGILAWDSATVELCLSKRQEGGGYILGNDLRTELADKPVLPANVLDYLLDYPHFIPEAWKGEYVFFWGTIYRDVVGFLYVRCLRWLGRRYDWRYFGLGSGFFSSHPAALHAR